MMAAAPRPQSRPTPKAAVAEAHRWGAVALWLILALLALVWALPARAGQLDVLAGAAAQGTSFGLRVTPGATCASQQDVVVPTGNVNTDYEGCSTVTAGGSGATRVVSPGAVFTAGETVILGDQFSVDSGPGIFTAKIQTNLTPFAYVQDNSPAAEQSYNASFYLRLNDLTFGDTAVRLHHFVGYSSDGTPWFRIVLRKNSTEKRLYLEARKNTGSWESTENGTEVLLPDGWNEISIQWSAGQSGDFQVSLDGVNFSGLSGFDNSNARIDHVKWGAVDTDPDSSIAAVTGTLDIDEFSSWR